MQTQAVTKKAPAQPPMAQQPMTTNLMPEEKIVQDDMLLDTLLLQQALSQFVKERKAQPGEIVGSLNGDKFATYGEKLEIVPVTFSRSWSIRKFVGNRYEYDHSEPYTVENARREWEFESGGDKYRADLNYNFLVFFKKDIMDPTALPFKVRFSRTSTNAGKNMVTWFGRFDQAGIHRSSKSFLLSAKETKKDNDIFFVFNSEVGTNTTPEELAVVDKWRGIVAQGQVKVEAPEDVAAEEVRPSGARDINTGHEI